MIGMVDQSRIFSITAEPFPTHEIEVHPDQPIDGRLDHDPWHQDGAAGCA